MLSADDVTRLLAPFGASLGGREVDKVLVYLDLLLRWSERINLTTVRRPQDCIQRHFGESLFLCRWTRVKGQLLDVGSGAGFPGLVLKLMEDELTVILLEPIAKKRAFLKEVVRCCSLRGVDVSGTRLEEFARSSEACRCDIVTVRAVGGVRGLTAVAVRQLAPGGKLCLWLGREQCSGVRESAPLVWREPIPIPLSRNRVLLIGERMPREG